MRAALIHHADAAISDLSDRAIAARVRRGAWQRIHRGVYVPIERSREWTPDELHIARALAVDMVAWRHRPVFSHVTAAVLLGMDGYGLGRERVHVTLRSGSEAPSSAAVQRHRLALAEADTVTVAGLRCTGLLRTLIDVGRSESEEQSAVVLDSGLRVNNEFGQAAATRAWRAEALERLERLPPGPGWARARRRLGEADFRAESVAESLSRLQLRRLGYPVNMQVPVAGRTGGFYWLDFEFLDAGAFGEVDGAIKYTEPTLRRGRSATQTVLDEKEREDWIRGTTGKRIVRWGFREAQSARALGERLAAFGVHPPPGPARRG